MVEGITKILKKGIIVIPKNVRDEVGLNEGDPVIVKSEKDKIIIERLENNIITVNIDQKTLEKILESIKKEEKILEDNRFKRVLNIVSRS